MNCAKNRSTNSGIKAALRGLKAMRKMLVKSEPFFYGLRRSLFRLQTGNENGKHEKKNSSQFQDYVKLFSLYLECHQSTSFRIERVK